VTPEDKTWIREVLIDSWASTRVVSKGVVHKADELPGIVALKDEDRIGLLTFNIVDGSLEIVTLDSLRKRKGIGSALIHAAIEVAQKHKCSRIWVVTTNDNKAALIFYQTQDFQIVAIHKNAIEAYRKLKPEIPLIGHDDIPILDEIELEKRLI
jgi:GNAT superfamily N-acetyltransferase